MCAAGGTYVASIAAIEAFRQFGWQKVYVELQYVYAQASLVSVANDKDDMVDDDGDGIADVDQIEAADLAQRKVALVMRTVEDPSRLQEGVGVLFTAYLAVLATLRLEFARTTAMALGIVEMAKFPLIRVLAPMMNAALGEELAHWTRTIIESTLTFFAIILAWYLQMIISAFYSGLRGGRMFADGLISVLEQQGLMEKVPFVAQPFDPNESFLDEAVGYSLAAIGFSFQFFNGFSLPFPLNLVFLPLTIVEWFLRLQISMEGQTPLV